MIFYAGYPGWRPSQQGCYGPCLLLKVLHQLRDAGITIVVIEHNRDVVKTADWVIDMGPEGGAVGGMVVVVGTPEDIAANPASYTGLYLDRLL